MEPNAVPACSTEPSKPEPHRAGFDPEQTRRLGVEGKTSGPATTTLEPSASTAEVTKLRPAALDRQGDLLAGPRPQEGRQLLPAGEVPAVDGFDAVARPQPGQLRRALPAW